MAKKLPLVGGTSTKNLYAVEAWHEERAAKAFAEKDVKAYVRHLDIVELVRLRIDDLNWQSAKDRQSFEQASSHGY